MMDKVNVYLYHNINSIRAKDGMYGIVLETVNKNNVIVTKEFFGFLSKCTIRSAELKTFNEALTKFNRGCELTIYVCNDYLEQGLHWCETWQQNSWLTRKGTEVANKEEWQKCLEQLKPHKVIEFKKTDHEYKKWLESEIERRKKLCLKNLENSTQLKN